MADEAGVAAHETEWEVSRSRWAEAMGPRSGDEDGCGQYERAARQVQGCVYGTGSVALWAAT